MQLFVGLKSMNQKLWLFTFVIWIASLATDTVQAAGVVDIDSRGEHVRVLVGEPEEYLDFDRDPPLVRPKIIGVAILFAGGFGVLDISEFGSIGKLSHNFLIRVEQDFRQKGYVTAIVDAPSDKRYRRHGFRGTEKHAHDVAAVIAYFREQYGMPVWLIGTSRGTNSVANAAIRLDAKSGPDGVVFSSTLFRTGNSGDHVFMYDLEKILLPTIVAHHRNDGCDYTPPGDVDDFTKALQNTKSLKMLWFDGGVDNGDPCKAAGHHGFAGIETDVVKSITNEMKAMSPVR